MDITGTAAITYSLATAIVVLFQIALAAGAPWGEYALGGKYPGRLPGPVRIASVIQAFILGLLSVVVLSIARVVKVSWLQDSSWLIWIAVVVSGVSLVLNSITPSARERRIWAPVAFILLASSLTVALTSM